MSGAFLYLACQTNTTVALDRICGQWSGSHEKVVDIYACADFSMMRCSLEAAGNSNDACQIAIRNCVNAFISTSRWEWGKIPDGAPLIHVENTQGGANLHNVSLHNLDVTAGEKAYIIRQWQDVTDVTGKFQLQNFDCNATGTLYICDTNFGGSIYWDATYREVGNEAGDQIYFHASGDNGVKSQPGFKPLPNTV